MLCYWLMALVHFVKLVLLVGSVKSMWAAFLLHFIHRICHERSFCPARETTHKYLKFSLSLPRNLWILGQLLRGLSPGEGALGWSFPVQSNALTQVGYGLMERCFYPGRSEATLEGSQESICWPGGQGLLWSSLFPCSPHLYLCWGSLEFRLHLHELSLTFTSVIAKLSAAFSSLLNSSWISIFLWDISPKLVSEVELGLFSNLFLPCSPLQWKEPFLTHLPIPETSTLWGHPHGVHGFLALGASPSQFSPHSATFHFNVCISQ